MSEECRNELADMPLLRSLSGSVVRLAINMALLTELFAVALAPAAALIPGPEKLLPHDTLLLVTAPDFRKLSEIYRQSPPARFLNDPAMKPFTDKFISKWKQEFLKPLQRELNVDFDSYASLLRGQVTFAVTQNGWYGKDDQAPGLLLLLDSRDKSLQLKTNLVQFRQKWVDAGKRIRVEKIRDIEFLILTMSSNDVPRTLKKFFPQPEEVQELGAEPERRNSAPETELVLGCVESLLILGNSTRVVEKVAAQLTGGSAPTLGELAAYQTCHLALFRTSPFYAWLNSKALLEIWGRPSEKKENPQAPNPFDFKPDKLIRASGLLGLKSIAFSFEDGHDGALFQLFFGMPEAGRKGIFKVLAGEPKETSPPAFVPADAVKFQRWRLDGQKAWAALEKMAVEAQWINTLTMILETANASARFRDPDSDIKQTLIGNLGDDIITYEKAPRGNSPAERESPPSILLLGCHNAERVAVALKSIFILMSQGANPLEREFLGRKIFSVPLPSIPLPLVESSRPGPPRALSYAASGGYVAFSTSPALLEEYLRSSESQARTLHETPGLIEAAQKVGGAGAGLFGYENRVETTRATFEGLKASSSAPPPPGSSSNPLTGALGMVSPEANFTDWMDFSLLPAFDKVSKYFYFTVYGGSASVEGLTLRMFAPAPPQLRAVGPEWAEAPRISR